MLAILTSLAAAAAFAFASYFKHRSAEAVVLVPAGAPTGARVAPVAPLVRATVHDPIWFAGIGADVIGLCFQVIALHLAALSVVQPILATTVIFSLVLRHVLYQPVTMVDFGWALLASAALAGFLLVSGPFDSPASAAPDRMPAVIAVAVGALLAVGCVRLARNGTSPGRSAALLGVAVGVLYAGSAALLKTVTAIIGHGVFAVVSSWQTYALVGIGIAGLVLNQLAFQAGPITASLPAIATVDPLASIAIGVVVYDEPIRGGALASVGMAATLLVLGMSTIQLARTAPR